MRCVIVGRAVLCHVVPCCAAPQTKETLTIKASSFGSKCELTPQLIDKVAKCGVMDNILSFAAFKNQKQLTKSDGAKRSRLTGARGAVRDGEGGGVRMDCC